MTKAIRVLVVDDSALMRTMISDILSSDQAIEVVGSARDGLEAVRKAKELKPAVVTMDVEMPGLDGLGALRAIMRDCPTRVIMLTGLARPGLAYEAIHLGAVDFISKPSGKGPDTIDRLKGELLSKVQAANWVDIKNLTAAWDPVGTPPNLGPSASALGKVVAIGASTGGPRALEEIFRRLEAPFPAAILIVQHLPPGYSKALADRLSHIGNVPVREAADGVPIRAGEALVAPGDRHMIVATDATGDRVVRLDDSPPVHHVRPAVDKLMLTAADTYGRRVVGVILSGMGTDGVTGMEAIKRVGGLTIVQDRATSVVFGMPGSVVERGLVDEIFPIDRMAYALSHAVRLGGGKDEEVVLPNHFHQ